MNVVIWITIPFVFVLLIFLLHYILCLLHPAVYPQLYGTGLVYVQPPTLRVEEQVERGKEVASSSTIVLCGLARNVSKTWAQTWIRLQALGNHFADYRMVVFENDSTDGTRDLLKASVRDNPKMILLDCTSLGSCDCKLGDARQYMVAPTRFKKMAFYRNQYLQYIQKHLSEFTYMMVIDLDMKGSFNLLGIDQALGFEEPWDAMAMNGQMPPGVFGLYGGTCTYDCVAFCELGEDPPETHTLFNLYTRMVRQSTLCQEMYPQPFRVRSAFNGMCLYNLQTMPSGLRYYGGDCEHLSLHFAIPRVFLSTYWIGYVGIQGILEQPCRTTNNKHTLRE